MKRSLILSVLCALALTMSAQQVTIQKRSKTIFQYDEFQVGRVLQPFGRSVTDTLNILLKDASLCFRRGGKIYTADVNHVLGVRFDSIEYRQVNGQMGRLVEQRGYNSLVCVTTINMKRYRDENSGGTNPAYFELFTGSGVGFFLDLDREPLREYEKGIPLQDTYYFVARGEVIPAVESKFKKHVRPEMKRAFKTLMGDRFWSWKDEKSLRQLLNYLPE
ncbi:MAG: hypothetical protein IJ659_04650 [Alloprevotella sp.]|nr:hypothetical protein [Alloprevotella sp.]